MKKQTSKQAKKASKLAKAENLKKKQAQVITVKNADGDPDTTAEILIQNQIDYTPKVSVIIPVYNVEQYLRECLDSVVNQTLKEIEIICVDDGSTDDSFNILKEYAKKDKRITVITQNNLHAGVARNAGLSQAKGEYIAFMDADDMYPSKKTLEHMYKAAIKNSVFICGGSLNQLKNEKLVTDPECFDKHFSFSEDQLINYQDYQFIYGYWRFIYNRKFLQNRSIVFPKHRRFQDPIFFLKAMHQAKQFFALNEATYVYRIINKNKEYFNEVLADMAKGMKDVVDYAFQHSLTQVYDDMYTRLNTKWMKTLLSNKSSDGKTFLQCIGPKRICDEQLENIDKIFKKDVLVSSFMGRDYFRYMSKNPNTVEEYAHITQKPECAFIHGSGTWSPQPETIEYAIENNIPLVKMEDGFLRSADTWCNHMVDVKYITGIAFTFTNDVFYFDATQSSFMERQINNKDFKLSKEQKKRAQNAIKTIIDNHLTKYNHQPIFEPQIGREGVKKILVVDQSYGDFSIKQGLADDNTFAEMLEAAIKENPEADIIIKTHPDAIAPGTKKPRGYYSTIVEHDNIYLMRQPINPISLLKYVDKVYVCTTQFGFEALMCGKEVHTFGMPFYAGWGLTIDKLKNPRRTAKRTLEELFYIAYIKNTYYVDPVNKCPCSIERAMEYLIELREEYRKYLTQPRISVIIPVYNVEKYLRECLDSIINQSYKNIEIICVNDGSTDNSLAILKEYAAKDSRFVIIDQKNQGLSCSRNNALKIAKGEYIFFLDSDDWIEQTCLEKLYNKITDKHADICLYSLLKYDEKSKELIKQPYFSLDCYNSRKHDVCNYSEIKNALFCRFGSVLKLYNNSFLCKYNISFQEGVFYEDVLFHIKTMIYAKKISFCDEFLYYYRVNRGNSIMSAADNIKKVEDVFLFLRNVRDILKTEKLFDELKFEYYSFVVEQMLFHLNRQTIFLKYYIEQGCIFLKELSLEEDFAKYNDKLGMFNDNQVKITVIIPVYNVEEYLSECLDSVINQTLKEIEIICVNDGSQDNSLAILKEYTTKDSRIIIIDQENQGPSCSRNNAMKVAKGQYFVFLDSDDYLEPNALEVIYNNMAKKQLDMLSYSGINFDNSTKKEMINSYWEFKYLPKDFNYEKFNYKEAQNHNFITKMAVSSCLTAYKRSMLEKHKITFPEHLYFEDNLFFIKSLLNAKYCGIIKDKLYHRRIHGSSTTQNWDKHFADYLKISDMVLRFVKVKDITLFEEYKNRYLQSCINCYNGFDINDRKHYAHKLKSLLKKYNYTSESVIKYPNNIWIMYLLFPYYALRLPKLKKKYFDAFAKKLPSMLTDFRIDIKNVGQAINAVGIAAAKTTITQPAWATNASGIGQVVSGETRKQKINIKAINSGKLTFNFRGQDKRNSDNTRIPLWCDYKSIKIDGKKINDKTVQTWHDKPFKYEMPVKDGQEVELEIEQTYHKYNKDELKNLLLKLNANSNYIVQNIDKLTDAVYENIYSVASKSAKGKQSFKHFLYHKVKADSYTKTYICGIRVKKKPANIYEFIDKRLATLSKNWENKFAAVVNSGESNKKELLTKMTTLNTACQKELKATGTALKQDISALQKENSLIKSNSLYMIKALNNKIAEVMGAQAISSETLQLIQAENTAEILNNLSKLPKTLQQSGNANRSAILDELAKLPESLTKKSEVNKAEIIESINAVTQKQQSGIDNLLNNLKQYYVSRTKTDNYSLEFRTFADIAHCIRQNLKKIPNDVDLVVGIPRSGMIPAYIIALFMNKKCCSLDEFLTGFTGSKGVREVDIKEVKKVLVIDDSVFNGSEMARTKEKLAPLSENYNFVYATVYVKPDSEDKVDIWLERVSSPRVWQWNYLNHSIAQKACFDMDGVLCIDPTPEENDDGDKYLEFISNTKPLYIPTYEINTIVTSRLEKYREPTEEWLKVHGVKYKQLVMLDLPTAEERRKQGCHARFKAEVYKNLSDTVLFVESEPKQAQEIALLSGKTVICTTNDEVY